MTPVRIFGSVTSVDPATIERSCERLVEAGVDGLHIDIADGVFVPDFTFGPRLVASLRKRTDALLDVHMMVVDPEKLVPTVAQAGASRISFHLEATKYPLRVASLIRRHGPKAGLALNPMSPLESLPILATAVSFVNILTTEPDFDDEQLIGGMAERVRAARRLLSEDTPVAVDGGIDVSNIGSLSHAGANEFVVGRAICQSSDWAAAVSKLRAATTAQGGS